VEGHALLEVAGSLWRHGAETPGIAEREATGWMDGLEATLSPVVRRARPRRSALVTAGRMLLTGEVPDATGRAVETLGDPTWQARMLEDLEDRIAGALARDADRFLALTQRIAIADGLAETIRALAASVSERAGEFYR
jgi:hypothetical protein